MPRPNVSEYSLQNLFKEILPMDNDYVEYFVEFGRLAHVDEDNAFNVTVQANGEHPKLAGRS